ncbi:translation initiation factor IF-2-like [Tympanuchus pallidicinctus]|uniref:translation initiation factor IF-2-like n=1 Tax=Tympanuchus pallidicinctus TaxID=109042 RepID=UPI0022872089|nr:translation initiation factor IF-2-like [Tympanuchus pallidicinctus]
MSFLPVCFFNLSNVLFKPKLNCTLSLQTEHSRFGTVRALHPYGRRKGPQPAAPSAAGAPRCAEPLFGTGRARLSLAARRGFCSQLIPDAGHGELRGPVLRGKRRRQAGGARSREPGRGRVATAGASRPAAAPKRLPGGSEESGRQCRLSRRRRNGTRGGGGTAAPAAPGRAAPSAGAAPPVPAPSLAPTPAALACPVPMRPGRGLRRARRQLRHSAAEVQPGEDVG